MRQNNSNKRTENVDDDLMMGSESLFLFCLFVCCISNSTRLSVYTDNLFRFFLRLKAET